jgi:hypothetical protein
MSNRALFEFVKSAVARGESVRLDAGCIDSLDWDEIYDLCDLEGAKIQYDPEGGWWWRGWQWLASRSGNWQENGY